jgi:hypothetical protein
MNELIEVGRLYIKTPDLGELFIEANDIPNKDFDGSYYAYGAYQDKLPNQLKLIGHFNNTDVLGTSEEYRKEISKVLLDPLNLFIFIIDNGDNSVNRIDRHEQGKYNG